MFINKRILKRLMLKAYKGNGLYMGNYDGHIYLGEPFTASWMAKIAIGCVPREILATMVECAGEIPQPEESWTSDRDGSQRELFQRWSEPHGGTLADVTPVYVSSPGGDLFRAVQMQNCKILYLRPEMLDAIDAGSIDRENQETMIEGPFYDGEGRLYARTNQATWLIRGWAPPRVQEITAALEEKELKFDAQEG